MSESCCEWRRIIGALKEDFELEHLLADEGIGVIAGTLKNVCPVFMNSVALTATVIILVVNFGKEFSLGPFLMSHLHKGFTLVGVL